jgi:hypothetical protein
MAVGILRVVQAGSVRQDLGTSGAAAIASGAVGSQAQLSETLGSDLNWNGLAGASLWRQSTAVSSSGGAVFIAQQFSGLYEIRPPRLETIRVPNIPATEIVYTTRYGVIEVRDASGQTFVGA